MPFFGIRLLGRLLRVCYCQIIQDIKPLKNRHLDDEISCRFYVEKRKRRMFLINIQNTRSFQPIFGFSSSNVSAFGCQIVRVALEDMDRSSHETYYTEKASTESRKTSFLPQFLKRIIFIAPFGGSVAFSSINDQHDMNFDTRIKSSHICCLFKFTIR